MAQHLKGKFDQKLTVSVFLEQVETDCVHMSLVVSRLSRVPIYPLVEGIYGTTSSEWFVANLGNDKNTI